MLPNKSRWALSALLCATAFVCFGGGYYYRGAGVPGEPLLVPMVGASRGGGRFLKLNKVSFEPQMCATAHGSASCESMVLADGKNTVITHAGHGTPANVARQSKGTDSLFVKTFGVKEGAQNAGVMMSGDVKFGAHSISGVNVLYDLDKDGWWIQSQRCKSMGSALCCLSDKEDQFIGLHATEHHVIEPKLGICA